MDYNSIIKFDVTKGCPKIKITIFSGVFGQYFASFLYIFFAFIIFGVF